MWLNWRSCEKKETVNKEFVVKCVELGILKNKKIDADPESFRDSMTAIKLNEKKEPSLRAVFAWQSNKKIAS
ncbi:MAG: hypothetical protein H6609_17455 [Ignavibacteriales bacterium]|nr:hypothetical protein [Ignavibacteriales bacterium]